MEEEEDALEVVEEDQKEKEKEEKCSRVECGGKWRRMRGEEVAKDEADEISASWWKTVECLRVYVGNPQHPWR